MVIEFATDMAGREVQVKKKQVAIKDIFMQFLLHLNEDFDDDLLLDSLNVLVGDLWYVCNIVGTSWIIEFVFITKKQLILSIKLIELIAF